MAKSLVIVCILALVGCGAVSQSVRMDKFEDTSRSYEDSLRWGHSELMPLFLKTGNETDLSRDVTALDRTKIISYELLRVKMAEDGSRIEQTVKIKYYYSDELVEKSIIDEQLWEYDPSGGWRLVSGLPAFK